MSEKTPIPRKISKDSDLPLGYYWYNKSVRVRLFGRERNDEGDVIYYWAEGPGGSKFKAYPKELS
jgi:hypothetical protein